MGYALVCDCWVRAVVIVGFGCVACCDLCFRCGCWMCLASSLDLFTCIGGCCICGGLVILCLLALCLVVSLAACLVDLVWVAVGLRGACC